MGHFYLKAIVIVSLLTQAGAVFAEEAIVYPKNGQTQVQQGKDANDCRIWAKQQTGVDPAFVQGQLAGMKSQGTDMPKERPVLRGAVRGVAGGAALGAIHEDVDPGAGRGAAMGVTAGAMRGLGQRREMMREAQVQQSQQQSQDLQAQYDKFNRAFKVCMDAKGYSVG